MSVAECTAVELERRREQLAAEAVLLELGCERVDAGDLVVELWVADDHPLEAERVGLPVDVRALPFRDTAQQLLGVVLRRRELAGRHRLEDERRVACRLERALDIERHRRSREREELVRRRLFEL